jgi:two-component system, cell cycle sensor histidine kinase PleC
LASRANQRAKAKASKGAAAGDSALAHDPFPTPLRVIVLGALVLLTADAALTAYQLRRSAVETRELAASKPRAELIAARTEGAMGKVSAAARAGAALLARPGAKPDEAAALALRLGAPYATAAAVTQGDETVASAGTSAADWSAGARAVALAASGTSAVVAPRGERAASPLVAVAADGRRSVVAAADLQALVTAEGGDSSIYLVTADGRVIAAGDAAAVGRSASTLLAASLPPLDEAARTGATVLKLKDGKAAELAAAPVAGAGLYVLVAPHHQGLALPIGWESLSQNLLALLAPLAAGAGLTLVIFRQARRADLVQREQHESERKFRLAVEAARCGIWEWRIREDMVYLSDVTGVMFGWGGGGVAKGEDLIARIAPEHRARVRQALEGAADFGAFDVSFKVPGPDGRAAWIDARGQAYGASDEMGYGVILGVALDVTQERMAQARAQAAEARLHDAIESVSEAFVLWDRRGRLIMCNKTYREFFSLDPRILKPGAPRDQVNRIAEIAIRHQQPAPDGRRGVREAELIDGRWVQISERRTADGGLVMTASDITAVKRQEEARRRNEQALERAIVRLEENRAELAELAYKYEQEKIRAQQANTAKSEFLANMSHELRTPLNAINGFSEIMVHELMGPIGDKRYKEYAQDILTSGQHLLSLINDILDMAKIEAGKLNLNFEAVDIAFVIAEAVRLMRNRADAAGLELVAEVGALPEVQADDRAVKQILLNLLSNAIKFTPRGGVVQVKAEAFGDRVKISVTDTGIGISKDDLNRLAKPFEQIESQHSKTQQGTGLGLALSKSLIELHKGLFELQSEPGVGTTASFTLPVDPAATDALVREMRSSSAA